MKWMRYAAFSIGAAFGSVFLLFNLGTPVQQRPEFWETLTLLTGPVTLLAASLVGLKFEKLAGWWLLIGAAVTAVLFTARQSLAWPEIQRLVVIIAIFCLPMLCCGLLWLTHANRSDADGSRLPWMT